MGLILDGKKAALEIKEKLKKEFSILNRKATFAIIHFNDDASASYLKGRLKIASELGVNVLTYSIKDESEEEIINLIATLNNDPLVDGIMVDRPLPRKYNEAKILSKISIYKDIDGYTPLNLGNLLTNNECFGAATPLAAIRLCEFYNLSLEGKNVLVIGRSINVGKPLALLLLNKNATVTIAHSKTLNLKEKCKEFDFIFLALGKANFLTSNDISENSIIVDIGINFDSEGKLCGDADKSCYEKAKAYSMVPGGVGALTNVTLMENLLKAYKLNNK